jgi:beta-lactamase superfamily II metal-dependent hydrolase
VLALVLLLLPLRVAFVSVGQGDATLITSPAGKTVLVDGGPPEGARHLASFVRARTHAPLDLVLLTHRHLDHLGGLSRVIGAVGARLYLDSAFPHPSPAFDALMRLLAARHVPVRNATAGRRIDLGGGAEMTLLGPPAPPLLHTRSDVNANSVVSRLDYRRASFLFAGDAEKPTEKWLLDSGGRLRARVLKVAHHGSRYSSSMRFLRAVAPETAVICVGAHNDYHHPSPATIARLRTVGATVYRTDLDGDVELETDGDRIEVHTSAAAGSALEGRR